MAKSSRNKEKRRRRQVRAEKQRPVSTSPGRPGFYLVLTAALVLLVLAAGAIVFRQFRNDAPEEKNRPPAPAARPDTSPPEAESDIAARISEAAALQRAGRVPEAIDRYLALLKDAPNTPDIHNNLANLYARLERYDDAVRHFEKALELDPANPRLHYNLGHVYLRQGENHKALDAFEEAVALDPAFEEAAAMIRMFKGG